MQNLVWMIPCRFDQKRCSGEFFKKFAADTLFFYENKLTFWKDKKKEKEIEIKNFQVYAHII